MMIALTMYKINVDGKEWRVSERDIETFLHVCLWNGADNITIEREKRDDE